MRKLIRNVANAFRKEGNLNEAIAQYETALAIAPEDHVARNNLAWILATSSDATIRDAGRAVELASKQLRFQVVKNPNSSERLPLPMRRAASSREHRGGTGGNDRKHAG